MKHLDNESWRHVQRAYRALGQLAGLPPPEGMSEAEIREMARALLSETPETLVRHFEED